MQSSNEKSDRTIEEALKRYELYARAAGFSQHRIDQMRSCLGLLDRFLGGIKDIGEVEANDFRRFLADLRDRTVWPGLKYEKARHLSGTTITTYARAIKTFFKWLLNDGVIAENPLAVVPIPRNPKTLPKVYSEETMKVVFAVAKTSIRDLAIFCLFLDSGIRLAELAGLKMGDVDTRKGTLKVYGKGAKERFAYFNMEVAKYIDRYVQEFRQGAVKNDFLFLTQEGKPLQARGIQALLLRLGKKAGLEERLAPHKLRHTFATLSLKYGGNLEYIRKILGHTDIKTTSGSYLNAEDADISAAHRHFSPLSNLQAAAEGQEPVLPDGAKPDDQPVPSRPPSVAQPYVETPHRRQMQELAEGLITGLHLPWIKDSFIVELRLGHLFLGKERFPIRITQKGKIQLALSALGKGETDFLHQALYSHLKTGSFAKVLSAIRSWSEGVADNLENCHELLSRVRREIEEIYRTSIPVEDEDRPGFTMDFPVLVCADAVMQASGSTHFKEFPYKYDGLYLKFGAFIIFVGNPDEDLRPLEDAHRKLRVKCAAWAETKAIAKQRRDFDNTATAISQQLRKFIAMQCLPGHCELCS